MRKLVGMKAIHEELQEIFKNKEVYSRGLTSPAHFMVELDPGNGQTALVEYITEFLQEHKIRHFGGRDLYLEYLVDGTMAQLKWMFADISASAVYTNEFEGVVAMDIALLASKMTEAQVPYFLNEIKRLSKNVTFIFFISTEKSRNQDQLVKKVDAVLENNIHYFPMELYKEDELAEMVIEALLDKNVRVENMDETKMLLAEFIRGTQITTAKKAMEFSEKVVCYIDFSCGVPILEPAGLRKGLCMEKIVMMGGK